MTQSDARIKGDQLNSQHSSGDPFASAVRRTRMPMIITDPGQQDNPIIFANDAFLHLTGYERDDVIGRNCRFLQGPGTDTSVIARIREAIRTAQPVFQDDLLNYKKDGTPFWNALFMSPVVDDDGKVVYFFASQHDVTARKASERNVIDRKEELETEVRKRTADLQKAIDDLTMAAETKAVLLHEIDHRVKNNLQMISALIALKTRNITDPSIRDALNSMLERVQAISTVHRRLYPSDDVTRFEVADFVRDLVGDLMSASGREDLRAELDLETIEIAAARAAPLALVINELMTNAIKHAFPDRGGRILVAIKKRDDDDLTIRIEDNGVGIDPNKINDNRSYGATIVKTLCRQLQAKITWSGAHPGARVEISMPL
jgi:PAS domain S-box-containing protein